MTLVRLNNPNLVQNLAHEAFFRNFADSYLERDVNYRTNQVQYHVADNDTHFVLELAIPGLDKDDLKIELNEGVLTVSTVENETDNERTGFKALAFSKRFKLSDKVDTDKISAQSDKGILTITLPKVEAAIKKPLRTIEIQ